MSVFYKQGRSVIPAVGDNFPAERARYQQLSQLLPQVSLDPFPTVLLNFQHFRRFSFQIVMIFRSAPHAPRKPASCVVTLTLQKFQTKYNGAHNGGLGIYQSPHKTMLLMSAFTDWRLYNADDGTASNKCWHPSSRVSLSAVFLFHRPLNRQSPAWLAA